LSLSQEAVGGYGGAGDGGNGGAGGNAVSSLTLDDTKSATESATLSGSVEAQAGAGGAADVGNGQGGQGGTATATDVLTGENNVSAQSIAFGGQGGFSVSGSAGLGGAATAESSATGKSVTSDASATGGSGPGGAGSALATAIGKGATGSVQAIASTSMPSSAHVYSMTAQTNADVIGSTTITAESLLQATAPAFLSSEQAVAIGTGSPSSASTNAILAANPTISSALGSNPSIFALEEVGGGFSVGGTSSETTRSEVQFYANLDSSDKSQDLKIGFYSGKLSGSGIQSVTLAVYANSTEVIEQTFGSGAAAASYFSDKISDIGSLSSGNFSAGTLNLDVILQVTSNSSNSAFYGGLLIAG